MEPNHSYFIWTGTLYNYIKHVWMFYFSLRCVVLILRRCPSPVPRWLARGGLWTTLDWGALAVIRNYRESLLALPLWVSTCDYASEVYIHIHLCTPRYILFVHYDKVLTYKCIFFCALFVQVHRLRSSRSSGSSGFGFSSHSHAKFVSQLMRESRLRVSVVVCTTLLLVLVWQA